MTNRGQGCVSGGLRWVGLLLWVALPGTASGQDSSSVEPYYGSFGTTVPIAVPKFHGIEPDLKLVYSSTGGNGHLGVGWGLTSFSTIERVSPTKGTTQYGSADKYLLDGQELMPCQAGSTSPSCTTGGTHSTRIENYQRIKFNSPTNTWTVTRNNGVTFTYAALQTGYQQPVTCTSQPVSVSGGHNGPNNVNRLSPSGANLLVGYEPYQACGECGYNAGGTKTITGSGLAFSGDGLVSGIPITSITGLGKKIYVRATGYNFQQNWFDHKKTIVVGGASILGAIGCSGAVTKVHGLLQSTWPYGGGATGSAGSITLAGVGTQYYPNNCSGSLVLSGDAVCTQGAATAVGSAATLRYGIQKVTDPRGNQVNYGWWCDPAQNGNVCYPDTVTYNGTTVKFYRQPSRPDPVLDGNGVIGQMTFLTKSIDVKVGSDRARAYKLSYAPSGSTGRSRLMSVQQYGRTAGVDASGTVTGSDSLEPMSYGYTTPATTIPAPTWTGADWSAYEQIPGDFNGDGKQDLYLHARPLTGAQDYMGLSNGATFTQWTWRNNSDWSQSVVVPGDYNGDGKTDIFLHGGVPGSISHLFLSTGSGFSWAWQSNVDYSRHEPISGDFNGDGKADIYLHATKPDPFSPYYSANDLTRLDYMGLSTGTSFAMWSWQSSVSLWAYEVIPGDFDGDGRQDLYLHGSDQSSGVDQLALSTWTGSGWSWTLTTVGGWWGAYEAIPGDYNGDGKTDILLHGRKDTSLLDYVGLSNGRGISFSPWQWSYTAQSWAGYEVVPGDYNADGRTDILLHGRKASGLFDYLGLSTGTGFTIWSSQYTQTSFANWDLRPGDFNGDGKLDFYYHARKDYAVTDRMAFGVPEIPDLMTSLQNGMGGSTTIAYTPSSAWSNTMMPVGMSLPTVTRVTTSDGRTNSGTVNYSYQGGLWSWTEQRFLGFRKVTSVIDSKGNFAETYYHQHVGCISKPETTYYKDTTGQIYSYSTFAYEENTAPPYTSRVTSRWDFECNQTTSCRRVFNELLYDSYGNITRAQEHGDYDVIGDERTTVLGYQPNASAFIVSKMAYENVYLGIGTAGALLRQTLQEYDGSGNYQTAPTVGNLTKKKSWNSTTGGYVNVSMAYDAYGNQTSFTDPLGRTTTTTWDPTYHLYPTQQCPPLGPCVFETWDTVMGLLTSETDVNNQRIDYTFDAFGRPWRMTAPDGGYVEHSYLDSGNPNLQRTRQTLNDGTADGLWTEEYRDGVGRVYKSVKEGGFVQETLFSDTANRPWKVSAWVGPGETAKYEVYSYDGAGRQRFVTHADGSQAQLVYGNGMATSYDELGREKVTWTDAYGQVTKIREKNGTVYSTTTYQYDGLGRLRQVTDAAGNLTTTTIDSLGRKLAMCDPDAGCTSSVFDDAGQLTRQTDAKGQILSFTYDALGRLKTKSTVGAAGATTLATFTYDEANHGHGIGRLTSVVDGAGSESLTYDFAGRVNAQAKCIQGVCSTTQTSYDKVGRLATVTYPDSEVVSYTYAATGRLSAIPGYLSSVTYNGRGQLLTASYPNGTSETFTYNDDRQWLTTASVTGPGATSLYQASYSYDAAAQVKTMTSTTNPLSNLSYTYDDLSRLTSVTGAQTQSFTYDPIGNMISNSLVGEYTYGDAAHKHAVTQAGSKTYTYDANGNMTSGDGRTLTWDSEDRPLSVAKGGVTTQFAYDYSGQRVWKSSASGQDYYFNRYLERSAGQIIKYYFAGARLIAKKDVSGSYWFHQDRLGSMRLMTDSSGGVAKRYDFASYGATIASSGAGSTNRGFGGHINDPETGLIYMNARYYDATLARFISSDSLVPDPHNPQAFNRYAYAYNNPISNIDPTGHAAVALAFVGALGMKTTIAWVAFALSAVGYVTHNEMLMTMGMLLSGFAGGPLSFAVTVGISPLSPLNPKLKEAIGWAYAAYGLYKWATAPKKETGGSSDAGGKEAAQPEPPGGWDSDNTPRPGSDGGLIDVADGKPTSRICVEGNCRPGSPEHIHMNDGKTVINKNGPSPMSHGTKAADAWAYLKNKPAEVAKLIRAEFNLNWMREFPGGAALIKEAHQLLIQSGTWGQRGFMTMDVFIRGFKFVGNPIVDGIMMLGYSGEAGPGSDMLKLDPSVQPM